MAGAVLRATGSTSTLPDGIPFSRRFTGVECCGPHTTHVSFGFARPRRRSAVSTISGFFDASGRNCLGRALRDRGQKRVPEPPAMMTGCRAMVRAF